MDFSWSTDRVVASDKSSAVTAMFDVRAIANFVLDEADLRKIEMSNMALNKIVYFVHCDFLFERSVPLMGAKIEAWQHGPVFRELYHEFKQWNDLPIRSRAHKVDPHTGETVLARIVFASEDETFLRSLVERYIAFSASQLRAMSHRDGGPWSRVWQHDGKANAGMKIDNELILEHYRPEVLQ